MVSADEIMRLSDRIAQWFHPRRIVLFGSYAYGRPTEDSDVDLLVVARHRGPGSAKAIRIRSAVEAPFPIDLLVRTPAELRQRIEWNDFFRCEVIHKGIVLYDAANAGVGRKGRKRLAQRATRVSGAQAPQLRSRL
jgi:predicted nucleotidyltransferase